MPFMVTHPGCVGIMTLGVTTPESPAWTGRGFQTLVTPISRFPTPARPKLVGDSLSSSRNRNRLQAVDRFHNASSKKPQRAVAGFTSYHAR